jgi:hypothetical protein
MLSFLPPLIINQKKEEEWAGRVAQVLEYLPSKGEALSSNPSIPLP